LLRAEFQLPKLSFKSNLRRQAASRWAGLCPIFLIIIIIIIIIIVVIIIIVLDPHCH